MNLSRTPNPDTMTATPDATSKTNSPAGIVVSDASSAVRRREIDCGRLLSLRTLLGEDYLYELLDELPSSFDSDALLSVARFGLGKEKILEVMRLGLSASGSELIARMISSQNGGGEVGPPEAGPLSTTLLPGRDRTR